MSSPSDRYRELSLQDAGYIPREIYSEQYQDAARRETEMIEPPAAEEERIQTQQQDETFQIQMLESTV